MNFDLKRTSRAGRKFLSFLLTVAMVFALTPAGGIIAFAGGLATIADSGDGLNAPAGVAVGSDGKIYVADTGNNAIKRMDADGSNIVALGSGFSSPSGIATGPDGKLYISDTGNNAIKRMDTDGTNIVSLGSGFSAPYGIAVAADGRIFVADTGNNVIKRMNADGTNINSFGFSLSSPRGIALQDGGETMRVTDASPNGLITSIIPNIGFQGGVYTSLSNPRGLAIGPDGKIYIADTGNNAVARANADGIITISTGFNAPGGVAVDASGNIYVADTGNNAIKKIQPYTMSYDENGGTGTPPSAVTAFSGETFAVAENTFTAPSSGMGFKEWNTLPGGTGTGYDPGEDITMPSDDLTLYAIWGTAYTVTYNANGGTNPPPGETHVAGQYFHAASPEGMTPPEGMQFGGWNTQADGTGEAFGESLMPSHDLALYAMWEPYQDGTEEYPFLISDYTDLEMLYFYFDRYFLQTQDIAFPDGVEWGTPEGLTGVYDGGGHSITDMKSDYGFIYYLDGENAVLKNLTLINPFSGPVDEDYVGALVASNLGGTVQNCHVVGGVISGGEESYVGGLVGINDGTVSDCSASDIVVIGGDGSSVGGLVGRNNEDGSVENCSVSGIIGGGDDSAIGLVERYGDRVTNCTTAGASILPISTTAQLCFDFEDGTFSIDGTEVTSLAGWSYENGVLTLDGFTHYTLAPYGLKLSGDVDGEGTMSLAAGSVNTIRTLFYASAKNNDTYGIAYLNATPLTINGTGTLNAQSGDSDRSVSAGLYTPYGFNMLGGAINASSGPGKFTYGIKTRWLDMSGGTVNASGFTAKSSSYGIFANSDITVSAGTVNAVSGDTETGGGAGLDDGIGISAAIGTESGNITVSGGNITAVSGDGTNLSTGIGASAGYDIENPDENAGTVTITGGTVTASAGESDISGGITAFDDIVISGGSISALGETQALFAHGTVTVSASEYVYQTNTAASSSGALTGYSTQALFNNASGTYKFVSIAPYIPSHTITATAGSGGSLSITLDSTLYTVRNDTKVFTIYEVENDTRAFTFTITPDSGYRINSVSVDGAAQGAITSYTFRDIITNHTINATFTYNSGRDGDDDGPSGGGTPPVTPVTATSQKLEIPANFLANPAAGGTVTLNSNVGNVTVPSNMLAGITGVEGKKAEIVIGQGDKDNLPNEIKEAIGDRPLISLSLTLDGVQTDWNNPDAPVKVSVPYTPAAGELANPESIVIWYIDGDGNAVCVPNGRYDPATGRVTFDVTHFSDYAVVYNPVNFSDVPAGAWYGNAVSFIAARDITTGTGGEKFSPDAKLTRGQFLVMLMKAYEIAPDAKPQNNFADAGNTYYTGYLAAAKQQGISGGVGDNMFAPEREITRQEMFTLLYNALKVINRLPEGSSGKALNQFGDAGDVASWATEALTLLTETGTVAGSNGTLAPLATTSRAEMAQVLYNLLSK
jgi:sugar lactone lactonase YvrE